MPHSITELIEALKRITVFQVIVFCISAASFVGPAVLFVKPIVKAQAGQIMRDLMQQEGIDPDKIKELPKQVDQALNAQTRIESDLSTLKAQQQQLIELLKDSLKNEPQQ